MSKTVNGKLLEFVWRGNQLVAETDGKGYWQSYLYEPGSYRPMALVVGEPSRDPQDKPPAIYWYQNDHLGTPLELTDSNGKAVWKGRFSAFGQRREEWHAEDASTINQPLRFQGQYADEESGLYYNLNRYYDHGMGRYLTVDPVGLAGGLNAYAYVEGNPVGWVDPLGLFKTDVTGMENKTVNTGEQPAPAVDATGRPLKSGNYSVIYEAKMMEGIHYPGKSDGIHFQEGNRQLYYQMKANPEFASKMEFMYPGISKGVEPGPRGAHSRKAPTTQFTWHHDPENPILQLVLREQHRAKGSVQGALHPEGKGGMENWGGGRKK